MARGKAPENAVNHGRNPDGYLRPGETGAHSPPRDRLPFLVLIFTSLFVLAFVAFECFVTWGRYRTTVADAERQAASLALTLAEHFEGRNHAADAALQQIAVLNRRLGGPAGDIEDWNNILNAAFAGTDSVGSLTVIDADGIVRAATLLESVGQLRSDRYVFTQLRDFPRDGMMADKPARSLQTGRIIIPIARRLEDDAGNFQGVVVATVWPAKSHDFYTTIDLGRGGMMRLMDTSGSLFYVEPALDPLPDMSSEDPVLVSMKTGAPAGVVWGPLTPAGENFVTAFRKTEPLGLIVSVSLARSDILVPWFKELWWSIGAVIVLTVVASAGSFQFLKHLAARRRIEIENRRLSDASRMFVAVVESSDDAIVTVKLDGTVLAWNPGAERLYGYSAEEAIGRSISTILPEDRKKQKPRADYRAGERIRDLETTQMAKDGRVMNVLLSITPIRSDAGEVEMLAMVAHDTTDRKLAEEQFQLAVEASPSGMLIADGQGLIVLVNVAIEKMFGYARSELLGNPVEMLVPQPARHLHVENRAAYFAKPETRIMGAGRDLRGVRRDGSEFPVEIGLNPIQTREGMRVLGVVVDITERQIAEEKFRLAVEASPSGMLIADGKGLIVLVNAAIEKMFGYARGELLGNAVEMLIPHAARHRHVGERTAYFANPETRTMGAGRDLRGVRRDGSEFPVEIGLNPIHTREGALVLGVVVDITERRAAQEAITQLNAELEERVRRRTIELESLNAELESFAYAVSHDLRGPIRAMDGFSQALVEDHGNKLDGEALDFLKRIRAGSQRMGHLIDDLLKLSRVTRADLKVEDVDFSVIAERIIQGLRDVEPRRTVETRVTSALIVRGDPQLIEIALQNLIANAWKFTGKTDKALIEIGCDHAAAVDTFFVRDNGVGFDNSYVDKLFKPFQRLHRAEEFEGTGIGLATVARIVRKHGGTIRAEANLGHGAAFYFTFEPAAGA